MGTFLHHAGILLKDFKDYATSVTQQIRDALQARAAAAGRPNQYLYSSSLRKEPIARQIAERDGIDEGLICVLRCVEPCWTFKLRRNAQRKKLELHAFSGKCEHYYSYYMHPTFGFMHVRLQTWFPFTIHACINGREWLARQMDQAGIAYRRRDNCFHWVQDLQAAQALMDRQLRHNWPRLMHPLVALASPAHKQVFAQTPLNYYWSIDESEWASDILFRNPQALAALYPRLIHYGISCLSSGQIMRFLGRKVPAHGGVHGCFQGQVVSDLKTRPEGVRLKHQVNQNSIKMYDKQGQILRVETTINNPRDIKTLRRAEGCPDGPKVWRKMRKGVADVRRRSEVSQAANQRYLEAMAQAAPGPSLRQLTTKLCRPVNASGQRHRAIRPFSAQDNALLRAVARGEFLVHGFRNRDLRELLFKPSPTDPQQRRRQSGIITRKLRLLRAHGLIRKISRTHPYQVTAQGRQIISAVLLAQQADISTLMNAA